MKRFILGPLSILAFLSLNLTAQTCCQLETMGDYQLLGASMDFIRAHAEPLPFTFVSQEGGEMITFPTADSTGKANGFLIKAKKKSKKWLFVYQEWWGLNDYVKKQAEAFYTDLGGEVNVLALDMYDGKVATKREDAGKFMGEAKEARLESIMRGGVKFAGKRAQIASVGWCFGGGLSLKSAIVEGKRAVGCLMYYGMPVKDVEKLKALKTDVKGYFSGREKWINKTVVEEFAKNMTTAGKVLDYKIYDAEHGFANPSNPNFDKNATEESYAASIKYLKSKFGI
jgi:carboxymethylenebutenolidase